MQLTDNIAESFSESLRILLPFMGKRAPSDRRADSVVDRAIIQSRILGDGRNTEWVENAAVRHSLRIQVQDIYGEGVRKRGGNLLLVHQIGSGHNMANCEPLLKDGYPPEFLAMAEISHDIKEDARKQGKDPQQVLRRSLAAYNSTSWRRPARESTEVILRFVQDLTDDPSLFGQARLNEQLERSRTLSKLSAYGRLEEKIHNLNEDFFQIRNHRVSSLEAVKGCDEATAKLPIIEALRVSEEAKDEYRVPLAILQGITAPLRPDDKTSKKGIVASAHI